MANRKLFLHRGWRSGMLPVTLISFGLATCRLLAQDATPAPVENKNPAAPDADQAKPAEPNIIIAKNVLLWEGKQIMTWDEVVARLSAMRAFGPIHPHFYMTRGINEQPGQWEFWHHQIMELNARLFAPAGLTFGSISPRNSKTYDTVKTPDDLIPNPALARKGKVLDADGKPAAGAQVFILPKSNMNGQFLNTGVYLKGTQLRDPFDEQWTPSGDQGEFVIYPEEKEYFIVAMHSSGFILQPVSAKDDKSLPIDLRLEPWATVTFSSTGEAPGQTADLRILPTGADAEWPDFDANSIETTGKPVDIKVPAGKITADRSLKMGNSSYISLPITTFSLKSSEQHTLDLKPPSDDDRKRAQQVYDQLHPPGGK